MLTVAEETLGQLAAERGKDVSTHLFGQEINAETYAICTADLLLKGEGEAADNIVGGPEHSTLANDAFPSREFDFMLSNPSPLASAATPAVPGGRGAAVGARPHPERFVRGWTALSRPLRSRSAAAPVALRALSAAVDSSTCFLISTLLLRELSRNQVSKKTLGRRRLAQAAMAHRDTSVSALCRELGISPVTLSRYVGPQGQLREQGV